MLENSCSESEAKVNENIPLVFLTIPSFGSFLAVSLFILFVILAAGWQVVYCM